MGSHHEEPPLELEDLPRQEDVSTADAAEQLEDSAEEKRNYTSEHPENFRDPPRSDREARGDEDPPEG